MTDLARALLDDLDPATLDRLAEALLPRILTRLDAAPATRPSDGPRPLLSAAEAAELTSVSVETVRRAVRSGALPAGRAGRRLRIHADDLEAWLRAGERPAPAPRPRARRRAGRPLADALARLDTHPSR